MLGAEVAQLVVPISVVAELAYVGVSLNDLVLSMEQALARKKVILKAHINGTDPGCIQRLKIMCLASTRAAKEECKFWHESPNCAFLFH